MKKSVKKLIRKIANTKLSVVFYGIYQIAVFFAHFFMKISWLFSGEKKPNKEEIEVRNGVIELDTTRINCIGNDVYYLKEIEAPEGYELPKKTMNVATFFVDNDGRIYGSNIIANKPNTPQKPSR